MEKEQFIEKFYKLQQEGQLDDYCFNLGQYEGNDFLIVDAWEHIIQLQALINGYTGSVKHIPYLWHDQDLNTELNKAEQELEKTLKDSPNQLGTIYRLESRVEGLVNLSAYRRWLYNNEIEEVDIDKVIDMGFSDEHDMCCDCYQNVVRTSPDSYCWTPPLYVEDEGYVCNDCAINYNEYVLDKYADVTKSIPDQFNTTELGLVRVNDSSYENGLYGGQTDDPKKIIKALNEQEISVWFKVYPNQFDVHFDAYVKEDDLDKAKEILENLNTYIGYDPAENLKKCLSQCSMHSNNEGVVYNKCNIESGTVETRVISREDFIEKGIK